MNNQWKKVALKRFVLGCGVKVGLAVVLSSAGGLFIDEDEDDTKVKVVGVKFLRLLTFGAYMAASIVTDDIMEKLYPFK